MAVVEDDDVVEKLAPNRSHEAFRNSIGASCRVHRMGSDRRDVFRLFTESNAAGMCDEPLEVA